MNTPMDPELKAKWVAALRSGEYLQGKGVLKKVNKDDEIRYCCLGVLCEVAGLELEEDLSKPTGTAKVNYGVRDTQGDWIVTTSIPESLAGQFGLGLQDLPDGNFYDPQNPLIDKNDNGVTFAKIADWIEENL
jgi:hypothetical protein